MQEYAPLEVKVWGEYACFTRPEMKVERVTYPVMTPSAARGVLEAIFWKPQFRWLVSEIRVLRPIAYFSLLRNEVTSKANERQGRTRVSGGGGYFAEEDRAQRNSLVLREVAYVIRADIRLVPGVVENVAKYRDQFRRRVQRGQCFHMPYLGCREFTASFSETDRSEQAIDRSEDLGRMLFDLDYSTQGSASPRFFDARLESGVMRIPSSLHSNT